MITCIYCNQENEDAEQYLTHMEQAHPTINYRKKTLFYQYLKKRNTNISGTNESRGMNSVNDTLMKTDEENLEQTNRIRKATVTPDENEYLFFLADEFTTWSARNKEAIQGYYEQFKHGVTACVNKVNVMDFFDTEQFRPIIVALSSPEAIGFRLMISFEALNRLYIATIKLLSQAYPNFDINLTVIEDALRILKTSGIEVCSNWNKRLERVFRSRRYKKRKAEENHTVFPKLQ